MSKQRLSRKLTIKLSVRYRWVILLLLFTTILIAFIGRLTTSVALKEIGDELVWSAAEKGFLGGVLMGIFLISYGFSNIFLSPNIDKFGTKIVLVSSMVGCSFSVFLGAFFGHIYTLFLVSRLLLGLTQGVMFPVATKVIAGWYDKGKRNRANSIFLMGTSIGVASAPIIMGPIIHIYSWQHSFYLVALIGFILAVPIFLFIDDSPSDVDVGHTSNQDIDIKSAFKELLQDTDFRQVLIGFTTVTSFWWGITLWAPTYLEQVYDFQISEMAYIAAIPYAGAIFGLLIGSYVSDVKGNPNKIIMFSLLTTGTMIMILTLSPISNPGTAIALLFFIFLLGQLAPPLFFTKLQNSISRDELGSATGLMNGIANTVGIIGPVGVGSVVALTGSYEIGLLTLTVIVFTGLIGFYRKLRTKGN
ncbi:MAG: MFS transporter [Candidatus Saliniplasma sp.]